MLFRSKHQANVGMAQSRVLILKIKKRRVVDLETQNQCVELTGYVGNERQKLNVSLLFHI